MRTYQEMKALVADMDEGDGYTLLSALRSRFNWAGVMFTHEDVEFQYLYYNETEDEMPDEVWQKVQDDYGWRHMDDMLAESGNTTISLILEDLDK